MKQLVLCDLADVVSERAGHIESENRIKVLTAWAQNGREEWEKMINKY